jgi:hypothetical protein
MMQTSNAGAVSAAETEIDVVAVVAAATVEVALRMAAVVVTGGRAPMAVSSKLESAVSVSLSEATLSRRWALHAGLASGELEERDGGEGGDHV